VRTQLYLSHLDRFSAAGSWWVRMSQPSSKSVSQLLATLRAGDDEALRALLPLIYGELRRIARGYLRKERPGHTLQSTALVHEAYLRLQRQGTIRFENRAHFFAICAQLMRQVLVEYARTRHAAKRDAGQRLTLDDSLNLGKGRNLDFVALDDALSELARLDAQQSRIVELRFFGGLSIEETSRVLCISPATVKRHWATARVWLHHEIARSPRHDS
jgi:RNA polymerase sigma factor (TIGR02999 family)